MPATDCCLIVFTKHPVAGQSKTRLARDIGFEAALRVNDALLAHTVAVAAASPAGKRIFFGNEIPAEDRWSEAGWVRLPQQGDHLGERMANAFQQVFDEGFRKVVIVGTDCYDLHPGILEAAFAALDHAPVAIGPASDGGYYLLGLTQPFPGIFENIAWSTDQVMAQTLERIRESGRNWRLLPVLRDIDHGVDLRGTDLEALTKSVVTG